MIVIFSRRAVSNALTNMKEKISRPIAAEEAGSRCDSKLILLGRGELILATKSAERLCHEIFILENGAI